MSHVAEWLRIGGIVILLLAALTVGLWLLRRRAPDMPTVEQERRLAAALRAVDSLWPYGPDTCAFPPCDLEDGYLCTRHWSREAAGNFWTAFVAAHPLSEEKS